MEHRTPERAFRVSPSECQGLPHALQRGLLFFFFCKTVFIFGWVFLAVAVFLCLQEPGLPFLVVHGLLIAVVSLVAACRLH